VSDAIKKLHASTTGWQPIETAPMCEMVLLWHPLWRHPFPGQRNGDHGAVWIDTCEMEARGRQEYATHWMAMPKVPR
jgi:hypothetical protein